MAAALCFVACGGEGREEAAQHDGSTLREERDLREAAEPRADRRIAHDDDGAVCLTPRDDGSVVLEVAFSTCLSSSCDTAENVTCDAVTTDGRIVVTSHMEEVSSAGPVNCTTDCQQVKVSCGVLEPIVGDRTLSHGTEESEPVSFPLAKATQLFGWSPEHCRSATYDYSR